LFNDKSTEGLARYENVQELLNSIKEFTETPQNEEDGEVGNKNLGTYLQQIALLTDTDEDKEQADAVKLMTIHAAKGLEFPAVFVVGLEENLFPSAMSINSREDLEEERRLFYVAITRAKSRLNLSFAINRYRFGQLQSNEPSRFLEEIDAACLERSYTKITHQNTAASGWMKQSAYDRMRGGWSSQKPAEKPADKKIITVTPTRPAVVFHTPSPNFAPSDPQLIRSGQKVEHQKFGYGIIDKMEGAAHNPIATIRFDINGEKRIMINYAKLRIVE
jgi:DNA helicase-2/ATP-dependent DNA helicase PcrA